MTSEDDFQKALDEDPYDWHIRLVFADWLQERDDPRADGYRALGKYCRTPCFAGYLGYPNGCPYWCKGGKGDAVPVYHTHEGCHVLPATWFDFLRVRGKGEVFAPAWSVFHEASRRQLEDAAALAYAELGEEKQSEFRFDVREVA